MSIITVIISNVVISNRDSANGIVIGSTTNHQDHVIILVSLSVIRISVSNPKNPTDFIIMRISI